MTRSERRLNRAMSRLTKHQRIQALEGAKESVDIESLLTRTRISSLIGGISNEYKTYETQVRETYRKYKGEADWGNQQARAVIDLRTSFIAGEGLSISAKNENTGNWISDFLDQNHLFGSRFFDGVLGTEITGKMLLTLRPVLGEMPKVVRIPYTDGQPYKIVLENKWDPQSIVDVQIREGTQMRSLGLQNFVYIRTAGDDVEVNSTPTKVGLVLNDIENYDRAVKDIRRLNHVLARITPTFETKTDKDAQKLKKILNGSKWKIGEAFIGTAKFKYEVPTTGAHDNLKSELATAIKTISSVTGAPVHWIGWTDLMSNRATATTLYDTLGTATVRERTIVSEGFYDLLTKAQELYIDSGGDRLTAVDRDFEVKIPVIDFSRFMDLVRGLSQAFNDGVISRGDYQSMLPGIDQLQTEKELRDEENKQELKLIESSKEVGDEREEPEDGDQQNVG